MNTLLVGRHDRADLAPEFLTTLKTPYPPAAGLHGQRCRVIRTWVQLVECPSRGDFVIPVHTQKRRRFRGTERDREPVEGKGQAFTDGL